MLDENLPVFFLKSSTNGVKHQRDFFLSHHGSDPEPSYSLINTDPASPLPTHKNCYAAGLYDSYNPDVLFGEAIVRPGWTQPTLSAEELRRNAGVPPPPQPVLPNEFLIQLYNPEQQVTVEIHSGKWSGIDSYEFSMPQSTFRTPSASNLDRGQSDPASLAITPRITFVWRKESKLGKDLTCFMTGRSTDATDKKKSRKDPDIAIALWRSLRELTLYEPNLDRIDMEDPKGLEVVLLLTSVVIKDVYFGSKEHVNETFNVSSVPADRKSSSSVVGRTSLTNPAPIHPSTNSLHPVSSTPGQAPPPPPADPRSQWELEAETARLRAVAEAEAKEVRRRRKEKEKEDEMERRRLQKMVDDEAREARRRQAEIDKETERLRKMYGVGPPPGSPSRNPVSPPLPPRSSYDGRYLSPATASSSSNLMSGGNPDASGWGGNRPAPKKKSFFGLRSVSVDGDERQRLTKKSSAMW